MAPEGDAVELPAPTGWTKKIIPKRGSTPNRGDIVFISPTGEEIKTKKQLEQYLKSHPGEPAASEFSWAKVDTPRRSARLSEKSKAVEAPAKESPVKKPKRSSSTKKPANEKSNVVDGNEVTAEEEESVNVATPDTNEIMEGEAATGKALPEKPDAENAEKTEKKDSTEPTIDTNTDKANSDVKESDYVTTHSAAADTKDEESNKAPEQQVVAGVEIDDAKKTSGGEWDQALEVLAGTTNVKPKETTPEAPSAHNDESSDAIRSEKGISMETITPPQSNAAASNEDVSKDKQSVVNAEDNKDPALQYPPATGS